MTGLIAEYPLGGMTWHYLQYVLGLRRLGHDVYYIEDSGGWPYDAIRGVLAHEHDANVPYVATTMAAYGLEDRWAYHVQGDGQSWWYGIPAARRREIIASADLLINVSGTLAAPDDYAAVGKRIYVDTDPVFVQIRLARRERPLFDRVLAHDAHFSFGAGVGSFISDPLFRWQPTRQPVVLEEWASPVAPRDVFTTVMNWTSYASEVHEGVSYGQKDEEFAQFLDLPTRTKPAAFEIAGGPGHGAATPRRRLEAHGWTFVDPNAVCPDLGSYRAFIQRSYGEWSVAKSAYVRAQSGWFSERSACYLAAGRPVIVQDTGFSSYLPTGEGLIAFDTLDDAVEAVHRVRGDYARHAEGARALSHAYFDSDAVLGQLIERAGAAVAT